MNINKGKEFRQEILGSWIKPHFVFPREFVEELQASGKVSAVEARAMLAATFETGRLTVPEYEPGEVPEWALSRLDAWRTGG